MPISILKLDLHRAMLRQLKKYGFSSAQLIGLFLFMGVGLFHYLLANDKCLVCFGGEKIFLVEKATCSSGIPALIPYSASTLDAKNRNVGPFSQQQVSSLYYRHWLGTDGLGRDLLAGLIHGTSIAFKISMLAMLLTVMIGIFFGYLSGYIGDEGFRVERSILLTGIVISCLALFYLIYGHGLTRLIATLVILVTMAFMGMKSDSTQLSKNSWAIHFDLLTMRLIETFKAIPDVFLVLVLIGMFRKANFTNIILIIALVRWPTITRYLRAEIIKLKEEDFIRSAQALGLSKFRIFKDHILPLAISPVIVATAFGFSSAILLESTLSFLGIGIPPDQVTWGTILNSARYNFSSWWLAFFPGLMIFLTVLLFNSLGDRLSDYFRGE